MAEDERGFDVELHVAGGDVIRWTIAPERLRTHRHPAIAGAARQGDRQGLRSAAVTMLGWIFDPKKFDQPVEVLDADGAFWIVPTAAVTAVKFRDPTVTTSVEPMGFRRGPEE